MTVAIRLKKEHLDAMVAHAREDLSVECCGLLGAKDGVVTSVLRAVNVTGSKYRFDIDPREYRKLEDELDRRGEQLAGVYHSHTGTAAIPSPTDVRSMGQLMPPPFVHFVIGFENPDHPEVRVWHIEGTEKHEREFEVVD